MEDGSRLAAGIWEHLVTRALKRALDDERELLAEVADLDASEASRRLTQYLAPLVERSLRSIGGEDTRPRVAVANDIIALLRTAVPAAFEPQADDVVPPARMLQSLHPKSVFNGDTHRPPRPSIPLSDTALLTNARDEPAVGLEIQRELETADNVDLLCAFVRFEGVRILERSFGA